MRSGFPTLSKWTYLDTARKTIPPRCVEWAMQEYGLDVYANAGADAWSGENVDSTARYTRSSANWQGDGALNEADYDKWEWCRK